MKKQREAVIWGAGKIGRGFLAEIFADAGYRLSFIEYDKNLLKKLKKNNRYTINKRIDKNNIEKVEINNFEAYHSQNKNVITNKVIKEGTIIAIAVHQKALPQIANMLAECFSDVEIRQVIEGALWESGKGLSEKYVFTEEDMRVWNKKIIKLLKNPILKDQLIRLGRDSQRKLGREDRLVGPASYIVSKYWNNT